MRASGGYMVQVVWYTVVGYPGTWVVVGTCVVWGGTVARVGYGIATALHCFPPWYCTDWCPHCFPTVVLH